MVNQCFDKKAISKIINDKKVRDFLTDDGTPKDVDIIIHPGVLYIIDEKGQGVVRVDQLNSICGSVHIATLPEMKGRGYEFATEAKEWIFKNTKYMKIVAIVPEFNTATVNLIKKVGMKHEGLLTKSFLKNWKMHDQLIFGITKGEALCQY